MLGGHLAGTPRHIQQSHHCIDIVDGSSLSTRRPLTVAVQGLRLLRALYMAWTVLPEDVRDYARHVMEVIKDLLT